MENLQTKSEKQYYIPMEVMDRLQLTGQIF